ncbi:alpha-1A adrenergic receptor-like [Physella acuta]|uniref:alpha-1A adrenergic receptor-like n=1 Tax=Physella acuta TaxID=109671 RepID=UPI0027DB0176|nr:alpha-1A adrenergic receptor-like [Physella acuta]
MHFHHEMIAFEDEMVAAIYTYETPEVKLSQVIFVVVASIYIPLVIFSNLLICCSIVMYPGFYNSNNMFILMIACFDFLLGAYTLPLQILCYVEETKQYISRRMFLCLLKLVSAMVSEDGSLYFLMLLSADRCLAINFPGKYPGWATLKRATFLSLVVTSYTMTKASLPALGWNLYNHTQPDANLQCDFHLTLPGSFIRWCHAFPNNAAIVVSSIINIQIAYVIFRKVRSFKKDSSSWTREERRNFRSRITSVKIPLALMFFFTALHIPFLLLLPFKLANIFPKHIEETLSIYSTILAFGNAIVKGPIYAVIRTEYRNVFLALLTNSPLRWRESLRKLHRQKKFSYVTYEAVPSVAHKKSVPFVDVSGVVDRDSGLTDGVSTQSPSLVGSRAGGGTSSSDPAGTCVDDSDKKHMPMSSSVDGIQLRGYKSKEALVRKTSILSGSGSNK